MNENFNKLVEFQKKYPELTFQNKGYQYLKKEIQEKYKEQIDEISKILKETIPGFSKFNNFKMNKDGSFSIRCQYEYDYGNPNSIHFIGVGYFNINDFKDDSND